MATTRPMADVEITLRWDTASKRWKLEYSCRVGKGRAYHWMWVESSAPVDAPAARELAVLVRRQLEARLF